MLASDNVDQETLARELRRRGLILPRKAARGASRSMRAPPHTIANARRLRRALSPPEAPAFRRQHPIGPCVLDFYCAKARLAVELDGMSHDIGDRPQRDIRREALTTIVCENQNCALWCLA